MRPRCSYVQAERVVRESLEDNAKGKAVSIPTKRYKLVVALAKLLPDRLTVGPAKRPRENRTGTVA